MTDRTDDRSADPGYDKPIPDILSQIKDSYGELRPAERRVADIVLADVAFSVDASNAEIARRADVSEPPSPASAAPSAARACAISS